MIFTLEYFIGLILIGVVAGFASGLLGVGGGFLIVPFQYFLLEYLGVDPSLAMMIPAGAHILDHVLRKNKKNGLLTMISLQE